MDVQIIFWILGAVKWSDQYIETTTPLPALPANSDRLAVDIAQDTINNLMEVVITSGALNGNISYAYVIENNIQELYFNNCGIICAGTILGDGDRGGINYRVTIPETEIHWMRTLFVRKVRGYPNGVLGVKWTVTDAQLKIKPGELVGTFKAIVNFTAETEHHQEHIVGAYLITSVQFQAKLSQDGLRIRPADVTAILMIDSSKIGKVLVSCMWKSGLGERYLLNTIAAEELKKKVIFMFKDFETLIPIQLPPDITFRRNSLSLHEGVLRVEADICYKQFCQFQTNLEWDGTYMYTQGYFNILDVLPTADTCQSGGQTSSSGERFVLTLSIALLRMMMLVLC